MKKKFMTSGHEVWPERLRVIWKMLLQLEKVCGKFQEVTLHCKKSVLVQKTLIYINLQCFLAFILKRRAKGIQTVTLTEITRLYEVPAVMSFIQIQLTTKFFFLSHWLVPPLNFPVGSIWYLLMKIVFRVIIQVAIFSLSFLFACSISLIHIQSNFLKEFAMLKLDERVMQFLRPCMSPLNLAKQEIK